MSNKGFVIALATIITLLCLYFLSFTLISMRVQKEALTKATGKDGVVDLAKKQAYIDSIYFLPVYDFMGIKEYTYKEVKDNELSLGLDLQGGMHVTLEVSPVEIVKGLSANSQDSSFIKALRTASDVHKRTGENFSAVFFKTFKEQNPDKRLASVFANSSTRGTIATSDSDEDVIKKVNEKIGSAINDAFIILRKRLDQFGTSQPNIQLLPNTGQIQIEIPGADNPKRVRKLLQGVAKLEFWDLADANKLQGSLMAINELLVKEQKLAKSTDKKSTGKSENLSDLLSADGTKDSTASGLEKELAAKDSTKSGLDSLKQNISPIFSLNKSQGAFRYDVKDTAAINQIFEREDVKSLLHNVGAYWGNKPEKDQQGGVEALELYFLDMGRNGRSRLTGEVITDARLSSDEYGAPAVSMTMNTTGTKIWAKMTAEASSKTPKGRIAIVLDKAVYSAPNVINEIPNGNSQISGSFTAEEAKDLAQVLKAGSLPAPTKIVEEAIIGPTLGEAAQNQGLISMACGLGIMIMFMVIYYSKGGLVANVALLFNIFFILGILAQLNAALTLPGIAGIVLTMGMAVDANVLIYERIKEELRHGRRLKDAINVGFSKAFASIFDSNLTTFLSAFFLFFFGQGPLKGFAIVLMIGIATSFFSAIYISRVIIEWMVRKGDEAKISFETFLSNIVNHRPNFDFVGMRRINYLISVGMIVIGFIVVAFQGLNLGVDFKGGRSYIVSFNKPIAATDMKIALTESFDKASTEVKNYGSNSIVKVTTSNLIEDQSEEADHKIREELISGIESFTKLKYSENEKGLDDTHFTISSSSKVGPTVAADIKNSAFNASMLSLIAIFIYILIRFKKWQYSAGAIIATIHDALFVFAAFSIAHLFGLSFEVDQIFVAAILTVIGHSLNDTVIIFDRIREYLNMGTNHDRPKVFNDAINSTLSRTLITSGTLLVVVTVLLIFGGEVLRGFSFALFIGVLTGTYSSIFVAAPIVLDFDKKTKKVESKKTAVPA
jgi:SecD/SecF fusion protein